MKTDPVFPQLIDRAGRLAEIKRRVSPTTREVLEKTDPAIQSWIVEYLRDNAPTSPRNSAIVEYLRSTDDQRKGLL